MPLFDQDHRIPPEEAAEMTARYRETINPGDKIAGCFEAGQVRELLAQEGCEGLRYYYGINNDQPVLILVGVDADGNDMTEGVILEVSHPCPPFCSAPNLLNQ
jgi:hypothetical protein